MGENEVQQEQGPATIFPNAGEFVHSWLLQVMNRKVNSRDTFWCAQWWKHPEAAVPFDGVVAVLGGFP